MTEHVLPRAAVINFVHQSTFVVSGPTGCGKTAFVVRIFKESMLRSEDGFLPERLVWLYGTEQPALFDELRRALPASTKLDLHPGLNGSDDLLDTLQPSVRNVVVIDDLMAEAKDSAAVALLFTVGSHHANTTVIYIVQNFFEKGTKTTTISRNAHYIVLFKNPRNTTDVRSLASQMLGGDGGKNSVANFVPLYREVTKDPFAYLLVDFRPETPDVYRFRTNIFPGEQTVCFTLGVTDD